MRGCRRAKKYPQNHYGCGQAQSCQKAGWPASLRRYYPRQVQNRVFLCDSRGQGAITLSQPCMAPPAGLRTVGLDPKECKQNRAGFCVRVAGQWAGAEAINKELARTHEKSENFHIAAGMGACRPGIFGNQAKYCTKALYQISDQQKYAEFLQIAVVHNAAQCFFGDNLYGHGCLMGVGRKQETIQLAMLTSE